MDTDELERRLRENAFLFEDPQAYVAGVNDALEAVQDLAEDTPDVPGLERVVVDLTDAAESETRP